MNEISIEEILQLEKEIFSEDESQAIQLDKEPTEQELYESESVFYSLTNKMMPLFHGKERTVIPTGLSSLDKALDGGLYPYLYIIGAVSALGKTTFCLQTAAEIAKARHDVLFFSMEMSEEDLLAKLISRQTFLLSKSNSHGTKLAKTATDILTAKYKNEDEKQLAEDAISACGENAKHLFIIEGNGEMSSKNIRERIEKHIKLTGNRPVVFIDYLQIIAASDDYASDKKRVDEAVRDLKQISRMLDVPVIAISSFNRDSYTSPVSFGCFKESGSIEYTSDILIGLQYDDMDFHADENEKSHEVRIRKMAKDNENAANEGKHIPIQLKILKKRLGGKNEILLNFYPKFNCFIDTTPTAKTDDDEVPFDSMFGDLRPIE